MTVFKGLLLVSILVLAAADNEVSITGVTSPNDNLGPPPGPAKISSTISSSSTSPSPPSSTTMNPKTTTTTTTTTTSTTPKPTTTPTTSKPPTTKTTTTPTTTSTAKPTTPAPIEVGKWTVNYTNTNRTCLVFEAELEIELPYKDVNNTKKTKTIKVPSTAKGDGFCGPQDENLKLLFDSMNGVSFNFSKNKDNKYSIAAIVLSLNVTFNDKDWQQVILTHNTSEFSTPVSSSYKCVKEQFLNMTNATAAGEPKVGQLRISHLQLQAFRNASDTKFSEALDCLSSETPDVVPIAVGCALAALVIIVLIAYLIGRRRSQARGYLSMFAQNKREEDYIPMKNLTCFN